MLTCLHVEDIVCWSWTVSKHVLQVTGVVMTHTYCILYNYCVCTHVFVCESQTLS